MSYVVPLSYNPIDIQALSEVLRGYEGVAHGEIVADFEKAICEITGTPYAVALHSGTAAIHLALKVLGVGPGDFVIAPTFTYVASVSPVVYCGAEPVFVDCEGKSWNLDPALLERSLKELDERKKRPKAIIVVHAYGMPADMERIMGIARKWEIPVVEDAAEAFGATIDGQWVGTLGDMGIYSFNNNKAVTTFGGGVLMTRNKRWMERARKLSTHAREDKPYYEHLEIGFNYQMSPLAAAYGLSQFVNWERKILQRRNLFQAYRKALSEFPVEWQEEKRGTASSRWLTTVRINKKPLPDLTSLFFSKAYEVRRVWYPMHCQAIFKGRAIYMGVMAEDLFQSAICLPSGTVEDVDFEHLLQWLQSRLKTVFR